jgi:ribosome-binding protein aMBF1 (putative translation factor)
VHDLHRSSTAKRIMCTMSQTERFNLTAQGQWVHHAAMKLQAYMRQNGLTDEKVAAKLSRDRTIISKYRRGLVVPPLSVIAEIEQITDKAVSFKDFLPDDAA